MFGISRREKSKEGYSNSEKLFKLVVQLFILIDIGFITYILYILNIISVDELIKNILIEIIVKKLLPFK